jgi:hypothetical protein
MLLSIAKQHLSMKKIANLLSIIPKGDLQHETCLPDRKAYRKDD